MDWIVIANMNNRVNYTQSNKSPGKPQHYLIINFQNEKNNTEGVKQNRHFKQVRKVSP